MAMHIMTNFIDDIPNISTDMINDVRGQLVTPQNTLTIPHAAHRPTGSPNKGARKLPRAFACGTGMPLPPAPEGLFQKGHGDYHQPDEAISLKRVEMALVIYIKGILEICRKVKL